MLKLYENIKKLRKKRGLTQSDLAKLIGYSDKSMIAKIEKGIVDLPQSKIILIANILGCEPGTLMGFDDFDKNSNSANLKNNLSTKEDKLLNEFSQLNNVGQDKLIETASDMTFNPKYNKDFLQVVASHQRTDIEVTDEMIQHDNDIMDDENF